MGCLHGARKRRQLFCRIGLLECKVQLGCGGDSMKPASTPGGRQSELRELSHQIRNL